jgi:hypothetical protein
MLARDDSKRLSTLAHRLGVLDTSRGESEGAHDVADVATAIVTENVESRCSLTDNFSFTLLSTLG